MFKDYYLVLEVSPTAPQEGIKPAFKKQALKWHPDRYKGEDATQKMQDINEAFLVLNDPIMRKLYDIEYNRFNDGSIETEEFVINNNDLKNWIKKARSQAMEWAKQTAEEVKELSLSSGKKAGTEFLNTVLIYIGISIVISLLLTLSRGCSS